MTEVKRRILRSDFSTEKMLGLPPEKAREYFILNFFVPIAYNMFEDIGAPAMLMCLHIVRMDGFILPAITPLPWWDATKQVNALGTFVINTAPKNVDRYSRAIPEKLTVESLSKVVAYAFSECMPDKEVFTERNCTLLGNNPLIATFKCVNYNLDKYDLNILVKLKTDVANDKALLHQAYDTFGFEVMAPDVKRLYNALTGKWIGLCQDDTCESCKSIRKSGRANNFYAAN